MLLEKKELMERQSWTLNQKIDHTLGAIEQYYNHFDGKVYLSYSGGRDSTVLKYLIKMIYPNIEIVFCNTGMEYPETLKFVKQTEDVTFLKPKYRFHEIIKKYGYPVISKEQAQYINELKNTKGEKTRHIRLYGNKWGAGKVSKKWRYLVDAPFEVSHKCCYYLKKEPFKTFEKQTGLHPILGTTAAESANRQSDYLKHGCNAFNMKRPVSRPASIWLYEDVLNCIKMFNIPYSEIYDKTNLKQTGCTGCGFGIQKDGNPNRFQCMKKTHPKLYEYHIHIIGWGKVLDYMGIPY